MFANSHHFAGSGDCADAVNDVARTFPPVIAMMVQARQLAR